MASASQADESLATYKQADNEIPEKCESSPFTSVSAVLEQMYTDVTYPFDSVYRKEDVQCFDQTNTEDPNVGTITDLTVTPDDTKVTLKEAQDGLVKIIIYLMAHPSVAGDYIPVLMQLLKLIDACKGEENRSTFENPDEVKIESFRELSNAEQEEPEDFFDVDQLSQNIIVEASIQPSDHTVDHSQNSLESSSQNESLLLDNSYEKHHTEENTSTGHEIKPMQRNVCFECGKSYSTKQSLSLHLKIHKNERAYKCDLCDKKFVQNATLKKHRLTHTQKTTVVKNDKCPKCFKAFSSKQLVLEHMKIHSEAKPYACEKCGASFAQRPGLYNHRKTHLEEKQYKCEECDRSFALWSTLHEHKRTHTGERPYKCSVCDRGFSQSGAMKQHMRVHTGDRPYQCSFCGKSFPQSSTLFLHLKIHTGEKNYKCVKCGKEFIQKGTLKRHEITHNIGEKPHKCVICSKGFTRENTLKEHMNIHTGDRPHHCDRCGMAFTQKTCLLAHVKIVHNREKNFSCKQCGRSFSTNQVLEMHMRTHTGEKPYICPTCGKGFTQSGAMHKHVRLHSGDRPYHCLVCSKKFTSSSALQRHTKTHSGEHMGYSCHSGDCGRWFSHSSQRDKHYKCAHNNDFIS